MNETSDIVNTGQPSHGSQERDILLYMCLRLVMLYSVVLSLVVLQFASNRGGEVMIRNYSVTLFSFVITTAFVFLYDKTRLVGYFLKSQLAYDILFTTVLIYYSGSSESLFTVFYLVNIIFAAILFRGRGALVAALASAGLYTLVCWFSFGLSEERSLSFFTTLTTFVAIALLAGQLVEEIRKGRQRITRLERISEEIIESLDSGLLGIDENGYVATVNRMTLQILGPETKKIKGRKINEVLPEMNFTQGTQIRDMFIHGKMRRVLASRIDLTEGQSMVLLRDLTEVLNLEERIRRQERLAGIGRLAAGIAHEIRNPIASMSGAAQLLIDSTIDTDERQRLSQIIYRESERVSRLVGQLLKFAKPTAVVRESIDIFQLIRDSIESFRARPDFLESGVDLKSSVNGSMTVTGNHDELSEVISNLLVNALEALKERKSNGRKELTIEGRKSGEQVEITVTDNGPGIPKEFRGRIFDPFFTTKATGTGLGLAQVEKIIRDHGGYVDIDTEEGKGTAMKVRLPA